jgi:hypothetical protein
MRKLLVPILLLLPSVTAHAGGEDLLGWASDGSWYATKTESCAHVVLTLCAVASPTWPADVAKLAGSDGCTPLEEDVSSQNLDRVSALVGAGAKAPAGVKIALGTRKTNGAAETTIVVSAGKKQHVEGVGQALSKAKIAATSWRPGGDSVAVTIAASLPGGCDDSVKHMLIVVSVADLALGGAKASPQAEALTKLVNAQAADPSTSSLYSDDAFFLFNTTKVEMHTSISKGSASDLAMAFGGPYKASNIRVATSKDGQAAWVSFDAKSDGGPIRVTEVAALSGKDWKIVTGDWSTGIADAEAGKLAAAGQLHDGMDLVDGDDDLGPTEIRDVFGPVLKGKADLGPLLSSGKDFLVIGTAPGEEFTDAKLFAKSWAAWRKAGAYGGPGKLRAGVAPSGSVGWIAGNVRVPSGTGKKRILMPYRVWFTLEKQDAGWRVVQAHFWVPQGGDDEGDENE